MAICAGCSAGGCICVVDGVTITGAGTPGDPFVGSSGGCTCVVDGTTITGAGTMGDPFVAVGGGGGSEVDVFVAASDTPAARQALANYVCDGVADQVEIQAAIDQLGTAGGIGGRVILMEGNFNTTATINLLELVSLYGMGAQSSGSTTNLFQTGTSYAIDTPIGGDGMELANFLVFSDGGGGIRFSGVNNARIRDMSVFIDNSTLPGIHFADETTGWIERCDVEVSNSDGIVVQDSAEATYVLFNTIWDGGMVIMESQEIQVLGNKITQNSIPTNSILMAITPTLLGSGIILRNVSDGIISDNIVTGAQRHGIAVSGNGGSEVSSLTNNKTMNVGQSTLNTFDGIFVEGTDQWSILHNRSSASQARYGINISDAGSSDNLVTNNDLFLGYVTAAVNDAGTGTIVSAGNRL